MAIEIIGKFGVKNGVQAYRINGSYDDLCTIIAECRLMNAKFHETPIMNPTRKGQWTLFLQIKVPVGEVCEVDKDS